MKVLAIDATSGRSSVAYCAPGAEIQVFSDTSRAHADALLPLITQVMDEAGLSLEDLDGLAFARGPGGFTGLRIAASVVQGLAYGIRKPVAAISSLAAIAQPLVSQGDVLVCTDARKSQVYSALFRADEKGLARVRGTEQVLDPSEVMAGEPADPDNIIGAGDGFDAYGQLHELASRYEQDAACSALQIARMAAEGWAGFESPFEAVPIYVRDQVTHGS